MDKFWEMVDRQLEAARKATTAKELIDGLNAEHHPSSGDAFFAGSGGDEQLSECLWPNGWDVTSIEGDYYWSAVAPGDGSKVTYVEGDIYLGDHE